MIDKRNFPRQALEITNPLVFLQNNSSVVQEVVKTKNVSASGACFVAPNPIILNGALMLCLKDVPVKELNDNRAGVIKAGEFLMAKVVRCHQVAPNEFEIGCAFIEAAKSNLQITSLFTQFVNHHTVTSL